MDTLTFPAQPTALTVDDGYYKAVVNEGTAQYFKFGATVYSTNGGVMTSYAIETNSETGAVEAILMDTAKYTMPAYDVSVLVEYAELTVPTTLTSLGTGATAKWSGANVVEVGGKVYAKRSSTATLTITTGEITPTKGKLSFVA